MKIFSKTQIFLAIMFLFWATSHVVVGQTANTFPSTGNAGIGTVTPTNALDIYGNNKRLLIRSQTLNAAGRPGIVFGKNNLAFFAGDSINSEQTFGFYSVFSNTRAYNAQVRIYGNADTWNEYLGLKHDGLNGIVSTDSGSIILSPATNKVGIGTNSPAAKLHINAGNNPIPLRISNSSANFTMDVGANMGMVNIVAGAQVNSTNNGYYLLNNRGAARIKLNDGLIAFYTSNTTTGTTNQPVPSLDTARVVIDNLGNVGIGTSTPASSYKLSVNGKIRAKEVVVETNWSDFVFAEDYKLMPLDELEKSIKQNRHLPGIPSEKEVAENGVSLGEMQAKLLQKIEELTLYVIELKKENDLLRQRMSRLEKQ
jgi:hypothetical protein